MTAGEENLHIRWFTENIRAVSGYSDETRLLVDGLRHRGCRVDVIGPSFFSSADAENPEQGGSLPIVYHTYRHNRYRIAGDSHVVGRTMIEVDRLPLPWVQRLNRLDEIWVPNRFNLEVFASSGIARGKLFVIRSPIHNDMEIVDLRSNTGLSSSFRFLTLFNYSTRQRKGLDVLLKAFARVSAADPTLRLVIKTNTSRSTLARDYPAGGDNPAIRVINRVLRREELIKLYRSCHCFVLPSRGEGVGRPLFDAVQCGIPVITTGWSGSTEVFRNRTAHLLKYRLVAVSTEDVLRFPGFYGARWAEPDESHLQACMMDVRRNHRQAQKRAVRARGLLSDYHPDRVAAAISVRLLKLRSRPVTRERTPSPMERLYPLHLPGDFRTTGGNTRANPHPTVGTLLLAGDGKRVKNIRPVLEKFFPETEIMAMPPDRDTALHKDQRRKGDASLKEVPDISVMVVIAARLSNLHGLFRQVRRRYPDFPVYLFD